MDVRAKIVRFATNRLKQGNLAIRLVKYSLDDRGDKDLQKDIEGLRQALTKEGLYEPETPDS